LSKNAETGSVSMKIICCLKAQFGHHFCESVNVPWPISRKYPRTCLSEEHLEYYLLFQNY